MEIVILDLLRAVEYVYISESVCQTLGACSNYTRQIEGRGRGGLTKQTILASPQLGSNFTKGLRDILGDCLKFFFNVYECEVIGATFD